MFRSSKRVYEAPARDGPREFEVSEEPSLVVLVGGRDAHGGQAAVVDLQGAQVDALGLGLVAERSASQVQLARAVAEVYLRWERQGPDSGPM